MQRHPDATVRRAIRVLGMVGELHRRGYQRLRVMPFMAASGMYLRCWIAPDTMFYRNHGAYLHGDEPGDERSVARYTTGQENKYFGWDDSKNDDIKSLADKFALRFPELAAGGMGWSYAYAGWFQRMLGLAEAGWMPVVISDDDGSPLKKINLSDVRPPAWQKDKTKKPSLPLPPAGKSQEKIR